ncbi:hypothetical protein [Anaerococcus provencensis]|nr:hypothetical protein [Anaerococcus provencensis]
MNIKKILLTALSISLLTPTASSYVATENTARLLVIWNLKDNWKNL